MEPVKCHNRTPEPPRRPGASLVPLGASLLLLGAAACQAFEPTIPERAEIEQAKPVVSPEPAPPPVVYEVDTPEALAPPAPPRIADDQLISFEMRSKPLAEAIHMIAESARVNIYLDAELDRMIDASFPSVTLDNALQVILDRNGLRLVEEPEGVYWVSPADGTEEESATFRVQSIDAASIEEDLAQLIEGSTRLVVNPEQNFVLVDGSARDVRRVADYLRGVDRLKRQVLLEVELVELMLDEDFQLGLSHIIAGARIDDTKNLLSLTQALSTGNGEFSLTLDNSDIPLQSTLTALEQHVGVNVVSSPRVLAVTKSPAKVEVLTEIPYIKATVSTEVGGGAAGTSTSEEVEFKEAGVKLDVTPTIQEGGVVEIIIAQELSNVIGYFQGIPVLDTRNLETVMLVQNQQTVVLGGLIQDSVLEDDSGVPGLMDIPLVGRLFRSDVDSRKKRQLLIFITPRILEPHEAASLARQMHTEYSETTRLAGVSSAEEE